VLEIENYEAFPEYVPTYLTAAAAPSKYPSRYFCRLSGQLAPYVDVETGTRFYGVREFDQLRQKKKQ